MKTKNVLLVFLLATFAGTNLFAVTHGSLIKKNVPIVGEAAGYAAFWTGANATVDFKAVTVNNTLWATFVGKGNYNLAGNGWSSQVQLYTGTTKTNEISIASGEVNYITVSQATKTMTVTAYPLAAGEANFNGFRALQEDNNQFGWTEIMAYNQSAPSSGLTDDTERPVLTKVEAGEQVGTSLAVEFGATDNSGDFFYYVNDAANGFATVFFGNTGTLIGLKANTAYNFTVVAIDFSGNESEPRTFTNGGEQPFVSVLEGIAEDVDFFIHSTANSVTIYAKPVLNENSFNSLGIQVGNPDVPFTQGENPYPPIIEGVIGYGANGLNFPGSPTVTKTITPVTANADGVIRVAFTYILGPNDEPVDAPGWSSLYEKLKHAGKLTTGARTGEYIDVKLGESSTKPGFTGLKEVNGRVGALSVSYEDGNMTVLSGEKVKSVDLYTISGQKVYSGKSASVPVSHLSKGVYVLKVTDVKGYTETIKTIVK
jgi:hypothetical protein